MSDMQKSGADPDVFDHIVHQGVLDYFGGETSEEIALVLIPGDLVVNGNAYEQWSNDFFAPSHDLFAQVPLYPVLGNHEVNSTYYFQYFHLPENGSAGYEEHWWYKDYGNVRFMGLDSNSPYDGDDQLDWLSGVLEATCTLEHIDFVFAELHHPHKSELWTPGESDFTGEVVAALEGVHRRLRQTQHPFLWTYPRIFPGSITGPQAPVDQCGHGRWCHRLLGKLAPIRLRGVRDHHR